MFLKSMFQIVFLITNSIIKIFTYKTDFDFVLPYYNNNNMIECNNYSRVRCLDGDMDSVFFV